jgi:hypothetical protein
MPWTSVPEVASRSALSHGGKAGRIKGIQLTALVAFLSRQFIGEAARCEDLRSRGAILRVAR